MPRVQQSGALNVPPGTTTTITGSDVTSDLGARGVTVYVKTTAIGTGSITVTIQGKDVASGDYYTLLAGAAITTNTVNRYTVYPGLTAAANVVASDALPAVWRVLVIANNANPATYTVGWSSLA